MIQFALDRARGSQGGNFPHLTGRDDEMRPIYSNPELRCTRHEVRAGHRRLGRIEDTDTDYVNPKLILPVKATNQNARVRGADHHGNAVKLMMAGVKNMTCHLDRDSAVLVERRRQVLRHGAG